VFLHNDCENYPEEGLLNFLCDYGGSVQADADSGYHAFFRTSDAMEVGCHAHAQRKFDYAMDSDPVPASQMLALWKSLYAIEKRVREQNYSESQRLHVRQAEVKPILDQIHGNLMAWKDQVLPKSPTGKAITYALNQWEALMWYVDDRVFSVSLKKIILSGLSFGACRCGSRASSQPGIPLRCQCAFVNG